MTWTRSIAVIALLCCAACGGSKQPGSQSAAEPAQPAAPAPAAATPANGSGDGAAKAKKCYADPDNNDDEHYCGGIGTCLGFCKGTMEECIAKCRVETCPEVPCPPGE